jgi:hypothetical protein
MRSSTSIEKMRAGISAPRQEQNFLHPGEIAQLLGQFENSSEKEFKATGPVCAPYRAVTWLNERIQKLVGPCEILGTSLFFSTAVPHGLHMDAPKDLEITPYKAILLPLSRESPRSLAPFDLSFILFRQYWYGFPAKFYKGSTDIYSPHNMPVYDYSELENIGCGEPVSAEVRSQWLTHLHPRWLEGLSVDRIFDWKIGSAIVFDSFQLHCSSDFRKMGVRSKTGLSIFTRQL